MALENRVNLERNKIFHSEDSMVMYGIYNSDTLEKLTNAVHKMHNKTTWNEKLFVSKLDNWYHRYLSKDRVGHYATNFLLYLTTMREKYVKMCDRFISQLQVYAKMIRVISKGYLPISLLPPSKFQEITGKVKKAIQITNPYYDIVIQRLHFYYDKTLGTFGIEEERNLVVQFPVFVQPYTQQQLILYQI